MCDSWPLYDSSVLYNAGYNKELKIIKRYDALTVLYCFKAIRALRHLKHHRTGDVNHYTATVSDASRLGTHLALQWAGAETAVAQARKLYDTPTTTL